MRLDGRMDIQSSFHHIGKNLGCRREFFCQILYKGRRKHIGCDTVVNLGIEYDNGLKRHPEYFLNGVRHKLRKGTLMN